ncbi:MAG: family 4 glycosyl hydrolase, partial [Promethearchaeota archaeon]
MSFAKKIVLVGAGSVQFALGTLGSILKSKVLEGSTVMLHDISAERLNLTTEACKSAIQEREANFIVESTVDRKEALKGADFIISSIEVAPRFELWDQDINIARELGNKQMMGENGGPGGLFHALRIIPPILDICGDVMDICPDALFINFSNPMSRICLAIHRKYPKLKFVGLCHEIGFVKEYIPMMLETPFENLEFKAGGLNHFGVILEIKYKDSGKDAYPDIRAKAKEYFKTAPDPDGYGLQLFVLETYGYLPYTGDSHYGEYIHWAWDQADYEGIQTFRDTYIEITTAEARKVQRLIRKGKAARLVKADDEEAIPIIEAILTDAKYLNHSVNLPNTNREIISNLSEDLVVECPAIIDKDGIHGIPLGEYPKGLAALLRYQGSVQDLVVEAAIHQSKNLAFQALIADPCVESPTQARAILEKMLEVQKDYLH